MKNRLFEVLDGKNDNYILPFFWMHGEEESVLRDYMEKIEATRIKAVCIESRPHPDYVGEKWWRDVDIILDEAKKRNMKVWILDDAHFPTGMANGKAKNLPDSLKKWHLTNRVIDVYGPLTGRRFSVASVPAISFTGVASVQPKEELVAVIIDRRASEDAEDTDGEPIDITSFVENGFLHYDFPAGYWRIFIITKKLGACTLNNEYINMLQPKSVETLIDAVYEPHYARYKDEFGKTIAGFFSDEPGFYNSANNPYDFELQIGSSHTMPLPWADNMLQEFTEETGGDVVTHLPYLWYPCKTQSEKIRFAYMDFITKSYSKSFTQQLGDWRTEHGVEYIGHVLEDNNVHARLGPGAGHYFRALHGQHMSGIDVVLRQILPGNDYKFQYYTNPESATDGAFYHYGLAKLGASMAHIDTKTKGRAMCEIFGAYGWTEGITLMKWLTDHMLVRGINTFVPHAFSPTEFPDPDCPPHFFARGNNPQYKHMHILFGYMNRLCHLLSGGKSKARVAVLYHAESEWMGEAEPFQSVGKELMRSQVDYDVVPMDHIKDGKLRNGILHIGDAAYNCLFVSSCEKMTDEYAKILAALSEKGFCIRFVNRLPDIVQERTCLSSELLIKSSDIISFIRAENLSAVRTSEHLPWLRYYGYENDNFTVHMFFNESPNEAIETEIETEFMVNYEYDALRNQVYGVSCNGNKMSLALKAGEAKVYIKIKKGSDGIQACENPYDGRLTKELNTLSEWKILLADYRTPDKFEAINKMDSLTDIAQIRPDFSGTVCYEAVFNQAEGQKLCMLDLGEVYEAAEIFINGQSAGVCIGAPYLYRIDGFVKNGENRISVKIETTMGYSQKDMMSLMGEFEPMGMIGPVRVYYEI